MSYLEDFRKRMQCNDYTGFLKIWEEYCYCEGIDGLELKTILQEIKNTALKDSFGRHIEKGLNLWRQITDPETSKEVLKLIFDIQNTNSDTLHEIAYDYLKQKYPNDQLFFEKLRLVGMKSTHFQGAISNYELLSHFAPGNFVYHKGGWGTSEIMDVSILREEITLECDLVIGQKVLSFENAFHTLVPLAEDHFLSLRFGNPDVLEKLAKQNPNEVLRNLLRDLGPKNALEIKDELIDLVIPPDEWNRWWQMARAKIKKDTKIGCPTKLKDPFYLRDEEIPHEVTFQKALEKKPGINETIQLVYSFLRDFPETIKNKEFKNNLKERVNEVLCNESLKVSQQLQLYFFLSDLEGKENSHIQSILTECDNFIQLLLEIEILSFKKRTFVFIQKYQKDWTSIFLNLLFKIEQNLLKDYLTAELHKQEKIKSQFQAKINELLLQPLSYPEVFVWYFQKIFGKSTKLPLSDNNGKKQLFENFLILLSYLKNRPQLKDLAKKMTQLITENRYKIIQEIMKTSSLEEVKEYLLLTTKCDFLSDHDIKIIHSLAEVVYPSLSKVRKNEEEEQIIWTTHAGFQKIQKRVSEIATIETVHNAKEIEAARALGDLRENAEFKAALEKRDRLQSELKLLSDQLSFARILTPGDILPNVVGVGSIVECEDSQNKKISFTFLGPWDADPEKQILSFQSKLAQTMKGKKIGEKFSFQNEEFTIKNIYNYFDQKDR